jgi:hypothetical protein
MQDSLHISGFYIDSLNSGIKPLIASRCVAGSLLLDADDQMGIVDVISQKAIISPRKATFRATN